MPRERWRVVQLVTGPVGKPDGFGSGYLVGRNVVLTAHHVVENRAPEECSVRFPGDPAVSPAAVKKIISAAAAGFDLAVLITHEINGSAFPNPVQFGRLVTGRVDELQAVSMGYPRWKRRTSGDADKRVFRTIADLRGRLKLMTLNGAGGLEFVLDDAPPASDEAGPWNAMSGSPVWVGNRLVAVVTEHHRAEGAARLVVQPVQDLYAVAGADGAAAVSAVGLPRSLDDLQTAVGLGLAGTPQLDPTGLIRYTLESDFLPRKALVTGTKYMIGRDRDSDVVVDRDGVSAHHCRIWVVRDGATLYSAYVQDEFSTNGTTVNDVDLKVYDPRRLSDGDKITIGMVATFHLRKIKRH